MDSLIVFTAKYLIYAVAVIAVVVALFSEKTVRNRIIFTAALALLISFVIASVTGIFYFDTRPFVVDHTTPLFPHAADNGFPSDHALYGMATAAVIFIFKRRTGIILGIAATLIGIARVAAGVHHPIDIIGGLLIGALAAYLGWLIMKALAHTRPFAAVLNEQHSPEASGKGEG